MLSPLRQFQIRYTVTSFFRKTAVKLLVPGSLQLEKFRSNQPKWIFQIENCYYYCIPCIPVFSIKQHYIVKNSFQINQKHYSKRPLQLFAWVTTYFFICHSKNHVTWFCDFWSKIIGNILKIFQTYFSRNHQLKIFRMPLFTLFI
jgi:hypothetical protein